MIICFQYHVTFDHKRSKLFDRFLTAAPTHIGMHLNFRVKFVGYSDQY